MAYSPVFPPLPQIHRCMKCISEIDSQPIRKNGGVSCLFSLSEDSS